MSQHSHEAGEDVMAVIRPSPRVPFPRGFGIVVLGIICAVLAIVLLIVIVQANVADDQRHQLACQVEELGGKPIGDVSCPPTLKPTPAKTRSPSSPHAQASPGQTTIVVVVPRQTPQVIYSTRTVYATPTTRTSSSPTRPAASRSPSPKASPSPTCLLPKPLPCPVNHRT